MTDKEKIRKEVEILQKELVKEKEKGFGSDVDDACILGLQNVLTYIDSLQEEPVSKDLEEAADKHLVEKGYLLTTNNGEHLAEVEAKGLFKAGALWQKQQLIDKACEWLKSYRQDAPDGTGYIAGIVNDKTIEDFKQAMEEQL